MAVHEPSPSVPGRSRPPIIVGLVGAIAVGLVILAFVWPAATATARDLPIGLAGPSPQVQVLEREMAKQSPQPFTFVRVDSRAEAMGRIRDRTIYGAVLLGDSPEVLTSSAANSISNQALHGVAAMLQARVETEVQAQLVARLEALTSATSQDVQGLPDAPSAPPGPTEARVAVTDVVPLAMGDELGAGLSAASFPLVLGGILGGVLVSLLVVGTARRFLALLVYGLAAGCTSVVVLQMWMHVLQRGWLLNAAAFGLAMLATGAVVIGFRALLGLPGIGVGAVVSLLVANPISGAAFPHEFVAAPWGDVGQYFVPGAASNLIRTLSYFPDAQTAKQWLVLAVWAIAGLLISAVGELRTNASRVRVSSPREPADSDPVASV